MNVSIFPFIKSHAFLIVSVILLVWGTLLRSIYVSSAPFGFDQVQIAEHAEQISQGDITLIGPRTGPANMFTGPLIYYIAGTLSLFLTPAVATIYTPLVISFITAVVILLITKYYLSSTYSLVLTTVYLFSPLAIHFDLIAWNPNLTILASSLVFFPLLKKGPFKVIDALCVCFGVFLGYQAHFSGLLLLPLGILSLLWRREWKWIPLLVIAFITSIIPTLIFDLRNNWLNVRGLAELVLNKDQVASILLLPRLINKVFIILETSGKIFFEKNSSLLITSMGFSLWFLFIATFKMRSERHTPQVYLVFPVLWSAVCAVFFALYRLSTPEYYFFILLPVLFFLIARVLLFFKVNPSYLIVPFGLYATLFMHNQYSKTNSLSYKNQQAVVEAISLIASTEPVKEIILDMKPVDTLGLQYLLAQNPIPFQTTGLSVHVAYPLASPLYTTQQVAGFSVWVDPRQRPGYRYVESDNYMIGTPETWKVVRVMSPVNTPNSTVYEIFASNQSAPLVLQVIEKTEDNSSINEIMERILQEGLVSQPLLNDTSSKWSPTTFQNQTEYFISLPGHLFKTNSPELVSQLELITN